MLTLAVMWGLSIPVTKLGLQELPPLAPTALRFAVAVPFLLPLAFGRRPIPWHHWPQMAALGAMGIGVGQVALTFGVAGTSASVGTISATIPVFIVIFAALRLKQSVSKLKRAGLGAAFVGIALVAFDGNSVGFAGTSVTGVFWMLFSSVAIAFYYVWSVELARAHGTTVLVAWSTLFGFLTLIPWAAWEAAHTPIDLIVTGAASSTNLGLVVTVAGLFLWLSILRAVPAHVASSVQYLQPVIGVIVSALVFGDKLGLLFVIGVVLVLIGLGLTLSRHS